MLTAVLKVQSELHEIGLDPEAFARLLPFPDQDVDAEARRGGGVTFQYAFSGKLEVSFLFPEMTFGQVNSSRLLLALAWAHTVPGSDKMLIPRLTLFVELENGVAVDAALSPETRRFLEKLVLEHRSRANTLDGAHAIQEEKPQVIQAIVQE
jgi:hypothetical protein